MSWKGCGKKEVVERICKMYKREPAATGPKRKKIIRIKQLIWCFGNRGGREIMGIFSSEKGYELIH